MKKSTLYEIYNVLNKDTTTVTDSLYKLMLLNSTSEDIFLEFCKSNSVNSDTFDYFINISECLDDIGDDDIRRELTDLIIDISNDDYIINNDDYDYILENIIFLLDFEYVEAFEIYENYELDYYKSIILKEFIRFMQTMKNIDINSIYNHDTGEIIDAYRMVLGGLPCTTTNDNDKSLNQMYIDRIRYFIDIISDKDIYEIDDDKFTCMLNVVKSTENIEELRYLKNIIKINRTRDINEFRDIVDDKSNDVNETTIERITSKVGLKKEILKKEKSMLDKTLEFLHIKKKEKEDEEIQLNVTRKVNDPKKELDIVKKVLKPLD